LRPPRMRRATIRENFPKQSAGYSARCRGPSMTRDSPPPILKSFVQRGGGDSFQPPPLIISTRPAAPLSSERLLRGRRRSRCFHGGGDSRVRPPMGSLVGPFAHRHERADRGMTRLQHTLRRARASDFGHAPTSCSPYAGPSDPKNPRQKTNSYNVILDIGEHHLLV
jgi:hypothetical protein